MVSKKKIANQIEDALYGRKPLSLDVYVEVLASHETKLKESLDDDADDALLCMIADESDVAMLVIDWDAARVKVSFLAMISPIRATAKSHKQS